MNEEEFDALMKARPFGTRDVAQWEALQRSNTRLAMTLGTALWGRTSEDLSRQLLASHPEIPPNFDLADFRQLLQWTAQIVQQLWRLSSAFFPSMLSSPTVFVGTERFRVWAARYEIVRRAVNYLEER